MAYLVTSWFLFFALGLFYGFSVGNYGKGNR